MGGARIGFLAGSGSPDTGARFGRDRAMVRALERQGNDVVWLRAASVPSNALGRALTLAMCRLCGAVPAARGLRPDWIISSHATDELTGVAAGVPVVYCADCNAEPAEAPAVRQASLCAFPSRVAAESAIRSGGVDPARVSVIPFGAGIDVPERGALPEKRLGGPLHLLFIAADWEREDGPVAFDTLLRLRELGREATLIVVGCVPPASCRNAALTVFPFLDRRCIEGQLFFEELYLRSHLLLMPGRSPAFGCALNEANGFGVPVVVADRGSLADAVHEGVNGLRLPLTAQGVEHAAAIARLWADPARYASLSHSSRETYERHGNWDAWAAELCRRVAETLQ